MVISSSRRRRMGRRGRLAVRVGPAEACPSPSAGASALAALVVDDLVRRRRVVVVEAVGASGSALASVEGDASSSAFFFLLAAVEPVLLRRRVPVPVLVSPEASVAAPSAAASAAGTPGAGASWPASAAGTSASASERSPEGRERVLPRPPLLLRRRGAEPSADSPEALCSAPGSARGCSAAARGSASTPSAASIPSRSTPSDAAAPDPAERGLPLPRPPRLRRLRLAAVETPSPEVGAPAPSADLSSPGTWSASPAMVSPGRVSLTMSSVTSVPFPSRAGTVMGASEQGRKRNGELSQSRGKRDGKLQPGGVDLAPVKSTRVGSHGNTSPCPYGLGPRALRTRPGWSGGQPAAEAAGAGPRPKTGAADPLSAAALASAWRGCTPQGYQGTATDSGPWGARTDGGAFYPNRRAWMLSSRPTPMQSAISALPP